MKTIELPCLAGDYIYAVGPQYKFYHPKAFKDCEYEVDKYYVRSIHLNEKMVMAARIIYQYHTDLLADAVGDTT